MPKPLVEPRINRVAGSPPCPLLIVDLGAAGRAKARAWPRWWPSNEPPLTVMLLGMSMEPLTALMVEPIVTCALLCTHQSSQSSRGAAEIEGRWRKESSFVTVTVPVPDPLRQDFAPSSPMPRVALLMMSAPPLVRDERVCAGSVRRAEGEIV